MNRTSATLAVPLLAVLVLLVSTSAHAAEPGGPGSGAGGAGGIGTGFPPVGNPGSDPGNTVRSAGLPQLGIQGKVLDAAGGPIGGVRVKLFSSGILVGEARTVSDGTFQLDSDTMQGERITTDLWFESPDPDKYIDVNVVLTAAQNGLFPLCTPRVTLRNDGATVEVTMRTAEQMQEELKRSDCLQGGAVQGPAGP